MSNATTAPGTEMSMIEHLTELRMRIIRSFLAIAVGMTIVMVFYDQVLQLLMRPYVGLCNRRGPELCGLATTGADGARVSPQLINLDPIGGFGTRMSLSFYGGLIIALPVVLWQIWRFIVPALHKNEKRYAIGFVSSAIVLFCIGAYVAFWTLGPALEFLISWAGSSVQSTFEVKAYVRLVTVMILAFGVTFIIPDLIVFLQLIGVVQWKTLLRQWRYAIVGCFLVAAVVTPSGDPPSMIALGLPLLLLYFLSVFVGWLIQRNRTTES